MCSTLYASLQKTIQDFCIKIRDDDVTLNYGNQVKNLNILFLDFYLNANPNPPKLLKIIGKITFCLIFISNSER